MSQKKILFLLKSEKTPSSRIRFIELISYLAKRDVHVEVAYIPKSFFARRKLFKKCKKFDLTIFQKRLFSYLEFCELRRNAKQLAFDFDDAVFLKNAAPSQNNEDYISKTRERRFRRICNNVNFLIVANSYLAEKCKTVSPDTPVEIISSSVDIVRISQKVDYTLSSPPVLGWIGSQVTHRYLEHIAPALCELRKKHNFVLNVISDKELNLRGLSLNNIQWSKESEVCELRKFDIGIMPLSEDPFSRGKASYKLLQYMAAGVPSVASAVGMNIDVAGDNKYALLANTDEDFISAITTLLNSCELRQSIGEKARARIKNKFSKEVIGANFADLLVKWLIPTT